MDPAASVEGARIRYARFPRNKKKKEEEEREREKQESYFRKWIVYYESGASLLRINQDWINFFLDIAISIR